MINKKQKKEIVNQLNSLLNDNEQLSKLCDELSNNIDKIIEYINKIIKYAFVSKRINQPLWTLIYQLDDIEEKYNIYLEKNRKTHLFSFLRKQTHIDNNITILDDTINLDDIEGLILPSIETIKSICENNLIKQKEIEESKKKKNAYYQEKRIFEETGFIYARIELITIDKFFTYYHPSLSGNIDEDYNLLYNDERYRTNAYSPLKNTYESNIENIAKKNDIMLKKSGNLYEMVNGRHRLMYILKHGIPVTIPVKMVRRIEDQEFNIILNDLQKEFKIRIYKNNLLNDEPNIVIILDEIAYEIKNTTELKDFYSNLKNKRSNTQYAKTTFNIIERQNNTETMRMYKQQIIEKYLEVGEIILTSNYTDIMKYFNNSNNTLFYDAFSIIQNEYQESLVFNYDFKTIYIALNNYDEQSNEREVSSKKRK